MTGEMLRAGVQALIDTEGQNDENVVRAVWAVMDAIRISSPPPLTRNMKYHWDKMAIGDAIFFAGHNVGLRAAVAAQSWGRGQSPKRRFSIRKEETGIRIRRSA